MVALYAILSLLGLVSTLDYKGKGFKKVNISCGDVIDISYHFKTLIECCGLCLATPKCEAVQFKINSCTTMKNIGIAFTINSDQEAWVEIDLLKFLRKNIDERRYQITLISFSFFNLNLLQPKSYFWVEAPTVLKSCNLLQPHRVFHQYGLYKILLEDSFQINLSSYATQIPEIVINSTIFEIQQTLITLRNQSYTRKCLQREGKIHLPLRLTQDFGLLAAEPWIHQK